MYDSTTGNDSQVNCVRKIIRTDFAEKGFTVEEVRKRFRRRYPKHDKHVYIEMIIQTLKQRNEIEVIGQQKIGRHWYNLYRGLR